MKLLGNLLGVAIGLAIFVGLLASGYYLFNYVVSVFGTLDSQSAAITAIASVVALLCAIIVASGLRSWRGGDGATGLVVEKARIYQQILSGQLSDPSAEEEQAAGAELIKLEQSLALHGGAKVVAAYIELRQPAGQAEKADGLNKLIKEMRADLGYSSLSPSVSDRIDLLLNRSCAK